MHRLTANGTYLAASLAHLVLSFTGWLSDVPLTPVLTSAVTASEPLWWTALSQALHALWTIALFILFLLLFHSVIEDTLMFYLFPVPILAVAWTACCLIRS